MTRTVAEIAALVEGVVDGNGEAEIRAVAGLREARAGEVSFLANSRYQSLAAHTRATAVLVRTDYDGDCPAAAHPA